MACDFWVTLIRSAGSPKKRKQAKLEVAFDGELEGISSTQADSVNNYRATRASDSERATRTARLRQGFGEVSP